MDHRRLNSSDYSDTIPNFSRTPYNRSCGNIYSWNVFAHCKQNLIFWQIQLKKSQMNSKAVKYCRRRKIELRGSFSLNIRGYQVSVTHMYSWNIFIFWTGERSISIGSFHAAGISLHIHCQGKTANNTNEEGKLSELIQWIHNDGLL